MNRRDKSIACFIVVGFLLLVASCLASIVRALLFGSFVDSPTKVVVGVAFGIIAFCFGLSGLAKAAGNAQKQKPSKNITMPCLSVVFSMGAAAYSISSIGLDPLAFFHWATWGLFF
ncbi:hypothetical protein GIW46_07300 [Pseudomonas syringae]|uniref:hypothetical protein n=1 Tax=Pseudomonas syringae group TaxID=136849 RepID=UPI001187572B|nr:MULTISPECIES: hypothetical protein [Pseudomonas syringae group]MCF8978001.1 hypothetical protein [Pseudomonas syringae]MDY0937981.1 hypothetical protein [Pseudomonas viridiflava]MDY1014510.1 hypothetical protein [Pseudomonas viridiflava]